MRKVSQLATAFLAVLALGCVAAASAFASYDSEAEVTTLKGSQEIENIITTNSGTWKCKSVAFEGTQIGSEVKAGIYTAAAITVHPTYRECRAFGLAMTVNTTGCNYGFGTVEQMQAKMHIDCAAGKEIVINAGFGECIIRFPAQTTGGHVSFTNVGNGSVRHYLLTYEVTGIEYTQAGAACTGGGGPFNNGTYTGSVTVKGFNAGGGQVGVWVTSP